MSIEKTELCKSCITHIKSGSFRQDIVMISCINTCHVLLPAVVKVQYVQKLKAILVFYNAAKNESQLL